jgi:hypothetical protein
VTFSTGTADFAQNGATVEEFCNRAGMERMSGRKLFREIKKEGLKHTRIEFREKPWFQVRSG